MADYLTLLALCDKQQDEIQTLKAQVAELEQNISMLERYNGSVESLIQNINAHNLEQQAKGIKDAIEYLGWEDIYTATCPNKKVSNELRFVAGQLSKEAQALKERGHE